MPSWTFPILQTWPTSRLLNPHLATMTKHVLVLGALSLMALFDHRIGNGSAEERQKLLDWLDALLASRDQAFEIEAIGNPSAGDLPVSSCGYLLANVEEPAEKWRRSWDLLVEQRRRAQHWGETDDSDALAPTLFLLAAGTSCIDWLLSPSHCRTDKARELWRALFDGAPGVLAHYTVEALGREH